MFHVRKGFIVFSAVVLVILGGNPSARACDICALHPPGEDTGSVSTAAGTTLKRGRFALGFTVKS